MNGLRIFSVDNIKVKRDDFDDFTTITVTVTDKTNKDFQLNFESFTTITVTISDDTRKDFELTLFTDKGFVPDMEVKDER